VDAVLQLLGKDPIHEPLPVDPALAPECLGDDLDPEMGLALGPRAGMPGVAMTLVDDVEAKRGERRGKLGPQGSLNGSHGLRNALSARPCQAPSVLVTLTTGTHTWAMVRPRLESRFWDGESAQPRGRLCDHPGCAGIGEHRAPQARDRLNSYYWFCLDHVREYNAAWNYYAGMSETEIENEIRRDMVGQRPTWPLGARVGRVHWKLRDAFGLFGEDAQPQREKPRRPETKEEAAVRLFGIETPFTLARLKARYKELVKLHHPDANGGDKQAEERLKLINQAYSTLKAAYFS
jgi:DnaJ-domain-containing protein 1